MPAVVVDDATGEAVSYAEATKDVAKDLPPGLVAVVVARLQPPDTHRWDAASRAFVELTAAELEAANPGRARRAVDQARVAVLRDKVGPGRPGLTAAERDEVAVLDLFYRLGGAPTPAAAPRPA